MQTQPSNWQAVFFDFLVVAILIFALFRAVRFLIPILIKRQKKHRSILRQLPVAETIVWLLFLSFYVFKFAEIVSMYALVVIGVLAVLIFWISRFFLKDLIAGMFFRISGRFKEGEVLSAGSIRGKILKFGIQSLEVESQEGPLAFIPYSTLLAAPFMKSESTEQSPAYTFSFRLDPKTTPAATAHDIVNFVIALPWSSIEKIPQVQFQEQEDNSTNVEITAFPIEKGLGTKIERMTVQRFSQGSV